jgi:EpsI family protein
MKNPQSDHSSATWLNLLFAAVLALLVCYVFGSGFYCLAKEWLRREEYWRFLVLLFSLYMMWMKKKEIGSAQNTSGILIGSLVTAIGALFFIAWKIAIIDALVEISLIAFTTGLAFLLLGKRRAMALLPALLFLLFATSMTSRVLDAIAPILQYSSATCAAFLLNTLGWPVLHQGLFLRLPSTVLEVASVCSGVNQLSALLAFAIPLAFIRHKRFWIRIVVIASAFPIALLFNSIRIFCIALWNYSAVQASFHGPFNILLIPVIYPFALGLLWLVSLILAKWEKKPAGVNPSPVVSERYSYMPAVTSLILSAGILLVMALGAWVMQPRPVLLKNDLQAFPGQLGPWHSTNEKPLEPVFDFGGPDETLARIYGDGDGNRISLYIGYFVSQNTGKRLNGTSFGSIKRNESEDRLPVNDGQTIDANKAVYSRNNQRFCSYYWTDVQGNAITTSRELKKVSAKRTLLSKANNGALIAVSFLRGKDEPAVFEERDFGVLKTFVSDAWPSIKTYLQTASVNP